MGTVELVLLALVAALAAGGLLLGGGGGGGVGGAAGASARVSARHLALIERRVEALRGLRFRRPVPVAVVSAAQARRAGLADYERGQPAARRRVDEEQLKLLGLVPPETSERALVSAIFAEQVAGYYDPRTRRLALVRGAGVDDATLAHELTHALEDQRFDLRRLEEGRDGDRALAEQALVEGTATVVETRYLAAYPGAISAGDALAALGHATGGTPLPPFVMRGLLFPYLAGERFVEGLLRRGHGWRLVDRALRSRPPVSTAQVLDPGRWLRGERPVRVRLGVGGVLRAAGGGWRRLSDSALGQQDLYELVRQAAGDRAGRLLAAQWRGGREQLWRRGPLPAAGCAAPCRERDVLAIGLRVSDAAAARAVAAALAAWARVALRAGPVGGGGVAAGPAGGAGAASAGRGVARLPGGAAVAVRANGAEVRLTLAPGAALAARSAAPSGRAPRR